MSQEVLLHWILPLWNVLWTMRRLLLSQVLMFISIVNYLLILPFILPGLQGHNSFQFSNFTFYSFPDHLCHSSLMVKCKLFVIMRYRACEATPVFFL